MAKLQLYAPQAFTAGALSWGSSPAYRSSSSGVTGWTDAPITGYPEVWMLEEVARVVGAGPNGENILRATNAGISWASSLAIAGIGSETRGQFDITPQSGNPFTVRWDQEFRTDYWDVNEYSQLFFLGQDFDHSNDAGCDFGSQAVFIELEQVSGYDFKWTINRAFTDDGSGSLVNVKSSQNATFAVANQWKTIKLEITPSTLTSGAFSGTTVNTAVLAADGAIRLYVKDSTAVDSAFTLEYELTGLKYTIEPWNSSGAGINFAKGLTFGEATFVGGITNIEAYWIVPDTITGSTVFGVKTTVTATRAFAVGLNNSTNTLSESGKMKVFGDFEATGDVTLPGLDVSALLDGLGT